MDKEELVRKNYTRKQVREFVLEIEKEELTAKEAGEKYGVTDGTVREWLRRYSKVKAMKEKNKVSEEVKKTVVRDIQAGLMTIAEASKQYNTYYQDVKHWVKKYSVSIAPDQLKSIEKSISEVGANKESLKQIEELKLKVIALETMIDVAEKELNIDIRKKSGTKQSL
jgi:transposase-like protein